MPLQVFKGVVFVLKLVIRHFNANDWNLLLICVYKVLVVQVPAEVVYKYNVWFHELANLGIISPSCNHYTLSSADLLHTMPALLVSWLSTLLTLFTTNLVVQSPLRYDLVVQSPLRSDLTPYFKLVSLRRGREFEEWTTKPKVEWPSRRHMARREDLRFGNQLL